MNSTISEMKLRELKETRRYILDELPCDMESMITMFRWIDFLLHRIKRERLSQLMAYYEEIGWIGPKTRSQVLSIARGTVQDISSFENETETFEQNHEVLDQGLDYQSVNDFRLTASDHIKTLMFVMKIVGEPHQGIDTSRWESDLSLI